MKKKLNRHDELVSSLARRLIRIGNRKTQNFSLEVFLDYHELGKEGEVDVLLYNDKNWYHFYEIKSTHTGRGYRRAQKQFKRFCEAYPKRKIKGVYVTPRKVSRLHYYHSKDLWPIP